MLSNLIRLVINSSVGRLITMPVVLCLFTFRVTGQNILPEWIDSVFTLTEEGSPYYADSDLHVRPEGVLIIGPGASVVFRNEVKVLVSGRLEGIGNPAKPILLKPKSPSTHWNGIHFENAEGVNKMAHFRIEGASPVSNQETLAAIAAFNTILELTSINFAGNTRCVYSEGGDLKVRYCIFQADNIGENVNIRKAENGLVENCVFYFSKSGDAIDLDRIGEGWILNNTIHGSDDDGIDIGENCDAITVENNHISGCADNAITVAESSFASINYNTLVFCNRGLEAKDGGIVVADHNTIHDHSEIAIGAYQLVEGTGGGTLTISNSIISGTAHAVGLDENSTIHFNYCLSDFFPLAGNSNIVGDPAFINPSGMDFRLQPYSRALDTGDPEAPPDPDGSRTDIGAFYFRGAPDHALMDIYPNPFRDETTIPFYVNKKAMVQVNILNSKGQLVEKTAPHRFEKGIHTIFWSPGQLLTGIYYIELQVDGKSIRVKRVSSF